MGRIKHKKRKIKLTNRQQIQKIKLGFVKRRALHRPIKRNRDENGIILTYSTVSPSGVRSEHNTLKEARILSRKVKKSGKLGGERITVGSRTIRLGKKNLIRRKKRK